jgi:adenylate cyclase
MIVKVVLTTQEKSFIRNAFGHYLSDAVIDELINDPEKLGLGGNKQYMTAIFTDIKGFSSISENMDPSDLVALLNRYLSTMSDIVLNLDGTIDKYEGDAIIGFFGAPIPHDDHARRACVAAVDMKRKERELNEELISDGTLSNPLLTRIGINTGEMVVGNMGTERKMNYTMMGNAVNLAARLEGVNKQFGSWILVSEATYMEAADFVSARRLDRVRVVGIEEPLRLYEVLERVENTSTETWEMIKRFHVALALFEEQRWDDAQKQFERVLEIAPEDKPTQIYIDRCKEYTENPPDPSWDGVFNLSLK